MNAKTRRETVAMAELLLSQQVLPFVIGVRLPDGNITARGSVFTDGRELVGAFPDKPILLCRIVAAGRLTTRKGRPPFVGRLCPECGGALRIQHTGKSRGRTVVRYLKCRACGALGKEIDPGTNTEQDET